MEKIQERALKVVKGFLTTSYTQIHPTDEELRKFEKKDYKILAKLDSKDTIHILYKSPEDEKEEETTRDYLEFVRKYLDSGFYIQ